MNTIQDPETSTQDHCIHICNGLLRGELSALETYSQAIENYSGSPVINELRRIRSEHSLSVSLLTANVQDMGGVPEKKSGAWGHLVHAIQGTANLFGANSAIESLMTGEGLGRDDYKAALLDDGVMEECKEMIRERLLPPVLNHIEILGKLENVE